MKPITYSLQFRGQVSTIVGGLSKHATAPGCTLVTSLSREGLAASFEWAPGEEEAFLASTLAFADEQSFDENATIVFSRGHALWAHGRGRVAPSADEHLRHGAVVWTVAGGEGQFENASGWITSNFLLSDTGDLTENQLGVIFAPRRP